MSTTTASVPDSPTIASDTDALILQHYAEIARYAVQLAVTKMSAALRGSAARGQYESVCDVCQSVGEPVVHDDSCLVGRVSRLAAEIATLKAAASERTIEYFPQFAPSGELVPVRTVTHEQAAQAGAVRA